VATVLLAFALALPLLSFPAGWGGSRDAGQSARDYRFAWDLVREDPATAIPLAIAFLWPLPLLALAAGRRDRFRRTIAVLVPLFATASILIVLTIPQVVFEFRFLWFLPVPLSARTEAGWYIALAANGLHLALWCRWLRAERKRGTDATPAPLGTLPS
jgi:hypothetical protein